MRMRNSSYQKVTGRWLSNLSFRFHFLFALHIWQFGEVTNTRGFPQVTVRFFFWIFSWISTSRLLDDQFRRSCFTIFPSECDDGNIPKNKEHIFLLSTSTSCYTFCNYFSLHVCSCFPLVLFIRFLYRRVSLPLFRYGEILQGTIPDFFWYFSTSLSILCKF